jgi:hypothetical protein
MQNINLLHEGGARMGSSSEEVVIKSRLSELADDILKDRTVVLNDTWGLLIQAPYYTEDAERKKNINSIIMQHHDSDSEFNAFATYRNLGTVEKPLLKPVIIVQDGFLLASLLISTILSVNMQTAELAENVRNSAKLLVDSFIDYGGNINESLFRTLFVSITEDHHKKVLSETFVDNVYQLTHSMLFSVLAHECAHHLNGDPKNNLSGDNVYSQVQEREADNGAALAISSCNNHPVLQLGHILMFLLLTWISYRNKSNLPSTHPLGQERFMLAMTVNRDALKDIKNQLGLSPELLVRLLPHAEQTKFGKHMLDCLNLLQ